MFCPNCFRVKATIEKHLEVAQKKITQQDIFIVNQREEIERLKKELEEK